MEASQEIFDSYNLNPPIFINEILNCIDDLFDGAFEFFEQRALEIAGADEDADKREEIATGISTLRNITQELLYKRLDMWEKYCLQHIFRVPDDFSAQEKGISGSNLIPKDALLDADADNQLEILRDKLADAGRESLKLKKQIETLENQSVSLNECDKAIKESIKLYEKIPMHDLFQEVEKTAPILHSKLKRMRECVEENRPQLPYFGSNKHGEPNAGFFAKLEDLQHALGFLKKVETWDNAV